MIETILEDIKKSQKKIPSVSLTGKLDLTIPEILSVSKQNAELSLRLSRKHRARIRTVHEKMIEQVRNGMSIYGTSTAYGAQSKRVFSEGIKKERYENASALSQAIIHVDVSTGPPIPKEITRAAMLIRTNMLISGVSAVRLRILNLLVRLLNAGITPIVGQYGSLGASGDLAQNGRVAATLLQLPSAQVWDKDGRRRSAKSALQQAGIRRLKLHPKEGLALVNGDNFSTAAAVTLAYEISVLSLINIVIAAINIQALLGSVRDFHPMLAKVRPHPGQAFVASLLRNMLKGSMLAKQELTGHEKRQYGEDVQDPYSIRCLPQYFGSDWEYLANIWKTINTNVNSISDNPIWTTPHYVTKNEKPYQWISGGNFMAMYMSETLDHLRKIAVRIVKQNDRHLARLVHPTFNNGLPANLSDSSDISQCTFKGLQTQMGMYDVYSTILATPISTAFGTHEEFNQDLTSHAMTSAILSFKYNWLRSQVPYIKKSQPLGQYVELVASNLYDPFLIKTTLREILTLTRN
jgi:phenylalanine ammonia-lyase